MDEKPKTHRKRSRPFLWVAIIVSVALAVMSAIDRREAHRQAGEQWNRQWREVENQLLHELDGTKNRKPGKMLPSEVAP